MNAELLRLLVALTRPAERSAASGILAQLLGAEDLVVFILDPEVGLSLPAPGFRQTLPAAASWRRFVDGCKADAPLQGELAYPDASARRAALGIAGGDGTVLVLLGGAPAPAAAAAIAPALPLLAAALDSQRHARLSHAQAALARQAADQSRLLAATLDRARLALRKALAQAEAASKAKDDFLAALSHELRTPLSPALITAGSMENDPQLSPEVRANAAIIRRSVELEARLIDDLLDLTRITHQKLRLVSAPTDIHAVLRATREVVAGEFGNQATIVWDLEAREHHVMGDAARLQQIFWNLLKNALKFTPTSGTIVVSTANTGPGSIRVRVSDNGIGIDPDMLPRIFGAFEQERLAAQQFGGLGLGLAIARALVALHGGTITADSRGRGHGATFSVELSTIEAPAAAPAAGPKLDEPRSALRLLLVEDHDSTREVLSRVLRRDGHSVACAATGREALDVLSRGRGFDLLLADIGLPDQSGLDLMRAVKHQHGIPGVALSGYGMEQDLAQSRAAGFTAHLVKPVQFAQLRAVLHQVARELAMTPVSTGPGHSG